MQVTIRVWRTKEAYRRHAIRRDLDGANVWPEGVYVLMRPDGQVEPVIIQSYLAHCHHTSGR